MNTIEINHLTKDYGGGKGIFDVSFHVKEGEAYAYLGPNGAGKSTTIRHLLGFLFPEKGNCFILGKDCSKDMKEIHKQLGYIPGEINLFDQMSGKQFLTFLANYRGMKDMGRYEELRKRFDLNDSVRIKKMSKGMKQKVGIIAAFMHDPKVLILDEPTSGLDPLMQNKFVELIQEEKKRGKTILMSSHMMEEVEKTCDRVGIIKDGHIIKELDIETLRNSKTRNYIIRFETQEDMQSFCKNCTFQYTIEEECVHVSIQNDINTLLKQLSNYRLLSLDIEHQNLEELFFQFYGGQTNAK